MNKNESFFQEINYVFDFVAITNKIEKPYTYVRYLFIFAFGIFLISMTEFEQIFGRINRIIKTNDFYQKYDLYAHDEANLDFWTFFNQRHFRISVKAISYRTINHWEKTGIILKIRDDEGTGWRRYSLMDVIWLSIVKQLRSFGLGLNEILIVRETLIKNINKSEYGELEFYSALAYINNLPIFIRVYSDFTAEIASVYQIYDSEIENGPYHNISINLNAIVQAIFPDKDCKPIYNKSAEITDEQNEILEIIRNEKVEEIKISVNKGKPMQMDFTMSEPLDSNIGQLKNKNAFQDINIKQVKSKTVSVKRTVSKIFK